MKFSVLHVSDLHRDLSDELANDWLLDSLERDVGQLANEKQRIVYPSICVVTGDLVYGVTPRPHNGEEELKRQYRQAEEFLVGLADRFFTGNRERIVILPGNHDVCFDDVMSSVQKIETPAQQEAKTKLLDQFFAPKSQLRWSWNDMCFFKIVDSERYRSRFRHFTTMYESFYQRQRSYPLVPDRQLDIFDFKDFGFCVVALNSCFDNDPLRRAGAFHPHTITEARRALQQGCRSGWLTAAAWHHNINGGPAQDDYLDAGFIQIFIDAGVSLGFHGHQHLPDCFDERYRLGPQPRKITIISASTLCASSRNLKPGIPRSYNVVELDTDLWHGRVHQRQMVNAQFSLPVWGPGHFIATNEAFFDFTLCKPIAPRPFRLDEQLVLDRAERLLGSNKWIDALDVLIEIKGIPLARPLLLRALENLEDARSTISALWPPLNDAEAVMLGGAILEDGTLAEAEDFMELTIVRESADASVREILIRIRERWFK